MAERLSRMSHIEFDFEWIDPAGARGPELRATWARLQILVDDEPVTRLIDEISRSVRTSVYLPLYPLAEWIATNWWFLFYEIERRGSPQSPDYEQRHNLRFGSEGFALPSVSFAPTGGSMGVQWTPMRLKHQRLEFTGRGIAQISVEDLRNTLLGFLQAVTGRLDESGVTQSLLANEARAINEIDPQEEHFCAAAAALGLEPYSLRDSQAEEIVDIAQKLPPSVVAEFFVIAEYQQLAAAGGRVVEGNTRESGERGRSHAAQ
jgi:hypothetical protein